MGAQRRGPQGREAENRNTQGTAEGWSSLVQTQTASHKESDYSSPQICLKSPVMSPGMSPGMSPHLSFRAPATQAGPVASNLTQVHSRTRGHLPSSPWSPGSAQCAVRSRCSKRVWTEPVRGGVQTVLTPLPIRPEARRDQEGPGGIGRGQEGPVGIGRGQEGSGGARRDQEGTGGIRRGQEESGGARRGQEGSGGGRRDLRPLC